MKNLIKIFFFAVISFSAFHLSAQAKVGVRGGINYANFSTETQGVTISFDGKLGYNLGLIFNFGLSENFSLQPELNLIQKGYKLNLFGTTGAININTIEVPLLAKLSFGSVVKGFVEAGPSVGYFLGGSTESGGTSITLDFEESGLERVDFGLQIGGGVGFNTPVGEVFIDLRYLYGMANLSDAVEGKTYSKGFNIGVGWFFGNN